MTRSFVAAAAVGLAIASLADAQPAAGLAPLSPQLPAGLAIPVLPANAPAVLVRAVESYKANPASLPAYAPALIKSATTPFTPTTKEEHKVRKESACVEGVRAIKGAERETATCRGGGQDQRWRAGERSVLSPRTLSLTHPLFFLLSSFSSPRPSGPRSRPSGRPRTRTATRAWRRPAAAWRVPRAATSRRARPSSR